MELEKFNLVELVTTETIKITGSESGWYWLTYAAGGAQYGK